MSHINTKQRNIYTQEFQVAGMPIDSDNRCIMKEKKYNTCERSTYTGWEEV